MTQNYQSQSVTLYISGTVDHVINTEDLFATLSGGEKFSEPDLSHAYQQLTLAPVARKLLTVSIYP